MAWINYVKLCNHLQCSISIDCLINSLLPLLIDIIIYNDTVIRIPQLLCQKKKLFYLKENGNTDIDIYKGIVHFFTKRSAVRHELPFDQSTKNGFFLILSPENAWNILIPSRNERTEPITRIIKRNLEAVSALIALRYHRRKMTGSNFKNGNPKFVERRKSSIIRMLLRRSRFVSTRSKYCHDCQSVVTQLSFQLFLGTNGRCVHVSITTRGVESRSFFHSH